MSTKHTPGPWLVDSDDPSCKVTDEFLSTLEDIIAKATGGAE